MSPGVPHMGYTYLNLLDSPELLQILVTLTDFNCRNKALTAKLLRPNYRYFKLRKAFSKFYRRQSALIEKYSVSLKTLLQQGISGPEFYGDLVYRFRKNVGKSNFSEQFIIIIIIIIIGFFINVQIQGQHPHQWASFQIVGLLHAWQISHQISTHFYHEG